MIREFADALERLSRDHVLVDEVQDDYLVIVKKLKRSVRA